MAQSTGGPPASSSVNMIVIIASVVVVIAFIAWLGWHYFGPKPAEHARYFMPKKTSMAPLRPTVDTLDAFSVRIV